MKATFKEINKNKLSLITFLKMKDEKVAKLKVKNEGTVPIAMYLRLETAKNISWKAKHILDMVAHVWNASTWEVNAEISGVQGQLSYARAWHDKTKHQINKSEIEKAPVFLKYRKAYIKHITL